MFIVSLFSLGFRALMFAVCLALTFLIFGLASPPARAQQTFGMGTGGAAGMYFAFGREISEACGQDVGMKAELEENGSAGNVQAILDNSRPWGMAQLDYLAVEGIERDLTRIKVLVPMFPEQVVFMSARAVTKSEGGATGWAKNLVGIKGAELTTVRDLAGLPVASFGGSVATAKLIQSKGVTYNMLPPSGSFADALALVEQGKAAALIAVQAKVKGNFRNLPPATLAKFKFLEVPSDIVSQFKAYKPSKVEYPGMAGVQSMEVMSAVVTFNYQKGPMVAKTLALRECILKTADELGNMPGKSPAWGNMKLEAELPWERWTPPASVQVRRK